MNSRALALAVGLASALSVVEAAETNVFISEWGLTLVQETSTPRNSDAQTLTFRLVSKAGVVVAQSPPLYGPLYSSIPNRELLSCEGNGVGQGAQALIFNLDARITRRLTHAGYLRGCGTSNDGRLYWLNYNMVEDGSPYNLVVVLGPSGREIHRQRLNVAGSVVVDFAGKTYSFPIPTPDLPG